ncbi:MAG: SDR family NAD(P)-dependent oxidoreductase [Gammaproteobacteria bacterium]|nr:SDR family NAD(P)-dependent oxidoreductase [Gammaproteobacteria bacterium]MDH3536885.1 SDR family NAD(P)-dependent oxidoreductase [Gammaproteobacteria bacterium]
MSTPVCAIVGAGEGLGRSLAAKFAGEGFDIGFISRTEEGSRAANDAAVKSRVDTKTRHFPADATQPLSIEQAMSKLVDVVGDVDVLIYNVCDGFPRCEPLDMRYDEMESIFRLEVVGAFAAAKSVLPVMRQRGSGSIFFSSATAALRGSANYPLYSIAKFGLRALSQSLARAYAKDGVHIAHIRLDCDLDVPIMRELYADSYDPDTLADPDAVAESYWLLHCQPRSAWSNEVELRPHTENWTF